MDGEHLRLQAVGLTTSESYAIISFSALPQYHINWLRIFEQSCLYFQIAVPSDAVATNYFQPPLVNLYPPVGGYAIREVNGVIPECTGFQRYDDVAPFFFFSFFFWKMSPPNPPACKLVAATTYESIF